MTYLDMCAVVVGMTYLDMCVVVVGMTYLDHAGASLYSEQQLSRTMRDMSENVYGNPHSGSECSQRTTDLVELVRSRYAIQIKAQI